MKIKPKKLPDLERIKTLDSLYTAAGTLRGRKAMKLFLRDLLTESERIMLGRRILIARQLIEGKTYKEIANSMGVGMDTVGRVQKWLSDQLPGYENAIKEMEKEFEKRAKKRLYAQSGLARLKMKYPVHFLLFPMPKLKQ
jgi:uncharacterized protein YerC